MTQTDRPTAVVNVGTSELAAAVHAALTDAGWQVTTALAESQGTLDLLVVGPMRVGYGALETTDEQEWWALVDAGVGHAFRMARACAPALTAGRGAIVFVSSQSGIRGTGLGSAISASSGAIMGLTRALAIELAPVRVNAVAAGLADDVQELASLSRAASTSSDDTRSARSAMTLLGRLASHEDIASAVAFLASPQASYFTGEVIQPNGGRTQQ